MKLRNYQIKAVEAVLAAWLKVKSCIVILPTGCGKTVVFGEVIRQYLAEHPTKAMILAHREELIHQAADKVQAITQADTQIEMGEIHTSEMFGKTPDVVVSTVQTQITGRMHNFEPNDYGVLVIDEAHHAAAKSYRDCIDHYFENPNCRLLGVTATPDRADELALGQIFDAVAYEYTVTDAIRDGWLVPVKQNLVKVGTLDFSGISTTCGDFNQGERSLRCRMAASMLLSPRELMSSSRLRRSTTDHNALPCETRIGSLFTCQKHLADHPTPTLRKENAVVDFQILSAHSPNIAIMAIQSLAIFDHKITHPD